MDATVKAETLLAKIDGIENKTRDLRNEIERILGNRRGIAEKLDFGMRENVILRALREIATNIDIMRDQALLIAYERDELVWQDEKKS